MSEVIYVLAHPWRQRGAWALSRACL